MVLKFFLNYGAAWLTLMSCIFLCAKFPLRKRIQSSNGENYIKSAHIGLGLGVVVLGFIHGWYSPREVISLNTGSVTWFFLLALACTWPLRRRFPAQWLKTHRVLAVIAVGALVVHIVEVGGFHIFKAWNSLQYLQDMGIDMTGDKPFLKNWMLP